MIKLWCDIVTAKADRDLKKYPRLDHESGLNCMRGAICIDLLKKIYRLLEKKQKDFFEKNNLITTFVQLRL